MSYSYHYIRINGTKGISQDIMRQLVSATNLNASGIAHAIGVAPSTITRILKGQVHPSYDDMTYYVHALGFQIENNVLVRPAELKGYRTPKEIGDFVNHELALGLDESRLNFLLRYMPKTVIDWAYLDDVEQRKILLQPAKITDIRFQALLEGMVKFYVHNWLWQDAPDWTERTVLKKTFVPRAAVRNIGNRYYRNIIKSVSEEFQQKNVIFSNDEMMVM
ncbi:MAG: helix-turn-helix domain-containing protein [Coriobacteriales bacterium]|jgi:transcriptional regulator with XRE-family HTH domain|nr:helix-turn-helix domain-containing protein [Coriobacteriales bacterium]